MTSASRTERAPTLMAAFTACCALAFAPCAWAEDTAWASAPSAEEQATPFASSAAIGDDGAPAQPEDAKEELSNVELRLWQLRREGRSQILAPLTLVVVGYGAALIGTAASLTTFAFAEQVQHREPGAGWRQRLDVNNDDSIDGDDEQAFRRMARSFAVISGVGAVIGVVGTVFLVKGLRENPDYALEVRSLRQRRRQLRRELEYGANTCPGGGIALSLRGRFF